MKGGIKERERGDRVSRDLTDAVQLRDGILRPLTVP